MLSQEIKEYGLSIGYSKVGIAPADCLSEYLEEVVSRGEAYGSFQKMLTKPIQRSMEQAKSIIVLVWDYYQKEFPSSLTEMIGKIYLGRCYNPPSGTLDRARLELIKTFLEEKGCQVVEGGFNVPARWVAAKAGVATFGRNNFAYTEDNGSYIVIHTLLVDQELDYGSPTMENKCPPNCRACIDACPTRALYKPFHLDPRKCIGFNNWMTQEGRPLVTSTVPYELREAMGCKIHGCDICQDVCPRNRKKLKQEKPMDSYIEGIAPDITLSNILHMPEGFFERRIRPIMYNYIQDKRYFSRNVALAMGNAEDERYVEDLKAGMESSDEMIREAAAWALGRIGSEEALNILKAQREKETSREIVETIEKALSRV